MALLRVSQCGRWEGGRGRSSLVPSKGLGKCVEEPPPSPLSLPRLLCPLVNCGFEEAPPGGAMGHLSAPRPPASVQGGPPWIFLFPEKNWASCSAPQDAPSRQPSHVPLRSWEMDYFTQAFANDGSNLNLQVGVDGRNSQASVSISLASPPPASAPHLCSLRNVSGLL